MSIYPRLTSINLKCWQCFTWLVSIHDSLPLVLVFGNILESPCLSCHIFALGIGERNMPWMPWYDVQAALSPLFANWPWQRTYNLILECRDLTHPGDLLLCTRPQEGAGICPLYHRVRSMHSSWNDIGAPCWWPLEGPLVASPLCAFLWLMDLRAPGSPWWPPSRAPSLPPCLCCPTTKKTNITWCTWTLRM